MAGAGAVGRRGEEVERVGDDLGLLVGVVDGDLDGLLGPSELGGQLLVA